MIHLNNNILEGAEVLKRGEGSDGLMAGEFEIEVNLLLILRKCDGERTNPLRELQGNSAFLNLILSWFSSFMCISILCLTQKQPWVTEQRRQLSWHS